MRRLIVTAITALVLTGALTACGGPVDDPTTPGATPSPAAQHSPTPSRHDLTRSSFNTVWATYNNGEKTNACNGLDLLGPDGTEEALQSGIPDEEKTRMDWAYFTRLLGNACDAR